MPYNRAQKKIAEAARKAAKAPGATVLPKARPMTKPEKQVEFDRVIDVAGIRVYIKKWAPRRRYLTVWSADDKYGPGFSLAGNLAHATGLPQATIQAKIDLILKDEYALRSLTAEGSGIRHGGKSFFLYGGTACSSSKNRTVIWVDPTNLDPKMSPDEQFKSPTIPLVWLKEFSGLSGTEKHCLRETLSNHPDFGVSAPKSSGWDGPFAHEHPHRDAGCHDYEVLSGSRPHRVVAQEKSRNADASSGKRKPELPQSSGRRSPSASNSKDPASASSGKRKPDMQPPSGRRSPSLSQPSSSSAALSSAASSSSPSPSLLSSPSSSSSSFSNFTPISAPRIPIPAALLAAATAAAATAVAATAAAASHGIDAHTPNVAALAGGKVTFKGIASIAPSPSPPPPKPLRAEATPAASPLLSAGAAIRAAGASPAGGGSRIAAASPPPVAAPHCPTCSCPKHSPSGQGSFSFSRNKVRPPLRPTEDNLLCNVGVLRRPDGRRLWVAKDALEQLLFEPNPNIDIPTRLPIQSGAKSHKTIFSNVKDFEKHAEWIDNVLFVDAIALEHAVRAYASTPILLEYFREPKRDDADNLTRHLRLMHAAHDAMPAKKEPLNSLRKEEQKFVAEAAVEVLCAFSNTDPQDFIFSTRRALNRAQLNFRPLNFHRADAAAAAARTEGSDSEDDDVLPVLQPAIVSTASPPPLPKLSLEVGVPRPEPIADLSEMLSLLTLLLRHTAVGNIVIDVLMLPENDFVLKRLKKVLDQQAVIPKLKFCDAVPRHFNASVNDLKFLAFASEPLTDVYGSSFRSFFPQKYEISKAGDGSSGGGHENDPSSDEEENHELQHRSGWVLGEFDAMMKDNITSSIEAGAQVTELRDAKADLREKRKLFLYAQHRGGDLVAPKTAADSAEARLGTAQAAADNSGFRVGVALRLRTGLDIFFKDAQNAVVFVGLLEESKKEKNDSQQGTAKDEFVVEVCNNFDHMVATKTSYIRAHPRGESALTIFFPVFGAMNHDFHCHLPLRIVNDKDNNAAWHFLCHDYYAELASIGPYKLSLPNGRTVTLRFRHFKPANDLMAVYSTRGHVTFYSDRDHHASTAHRVVHGNVIGADKQVSFWLALYTLATLQSFHDPNSFALSRLASCRRAISVRHTRWV